MLKVENLFLSYTKEYYTLNDISFDLKKGHHMLIMGQKESGKDSLLRIIAGLEKSTSGTVVVDGKDINKINYKNDINIGFVSNQGVFFNNKTVRKNFEYVLKIRGFNKEEIVQRVGSALLLNKMDNIAELKIKELSEFDKLRVSLVRLTLRDVDLLILDDIFSGNTVKENQLLVEIIQDIIEKNENITTVISASDDSIFQHKVDKVLKLKFGSLME